MHWTRTNIIIQSIAGLFRALASATAVWITIMFFSHVVAGAIGGVNCCS